VSEATTSRVLLRQFLAAFVMSAGLLSVQDRQASADPACGRETVPTAALTRGYTKLVMDSCPGLKDVSMNGLGLSSWYNGHNWWNDTQQPSPQSYTRDAQGKLLVKLGGSMATVTRNMEPGRFPLLAGSRGFYVEFTVQLFKSNPDYFPAVWVMPAEHSVPHADHYSADAAGYERWFELDVDEGGFTNGFMGTAIAWEGKYPNYIRTRSNPRWDVPVLDRTKVNTFAAAFEPGSLKVTWWLNGNEQYTAGPPAVSAIARQQHFYLIVSAQTHGKNVPYSMRIIRVRAYTPH
jgi:hypothetical protein